MFLRRLRSGAWNAVRKFKDEDGGEDDGVDGGEGSDVEDAVISSLPRSGISEGEGGNFSPDMPGYRANFDHILNTRAKFDPSIRER